MIRFASSLLAAVVAIVIAAIWVVPPMLDWNRYRTDIADLVSSNLGRAVAIEGPISLSLLPEPILTAGRVTVAEDRDGVAMAVSELRVRLALIPLLSGRVDAQEVVLQGLDIQLPWPLRQDRVVLQAPDWLSSISARVEGGRISVGSMSVTGIDATLGLVPDTGSYALAGTAQISGMAWHLTARLTRIGGDGSAGLDMSLDGQGKVQGLGAMFSGQIGADGALSGRISGSGPDLSRLLPAPAVPFKAEGRLSIAAGLAVADELTAEIAGSPARGAVALRLDPGLRLDVSITASRLNLDAWLPALLRNAGNQIVASIPTGIDLSAEAATLAGGTLRGLRGRFELDPSVVTLEDVAAILPGDAQLTLAGTVRRVPQAAATSTQPPARGEQALRFNGAASLQAANLRSTLGWLENAGMSATSGLPSGVLRTADLRATVTADTALQQGPNAGPQIMLTDLAGMVDQTHVQGSLTLRPANRLGIAGNLTLDTLPLDPWLAVTTPGLTGIPTRLGRFDLDVQLRAEQASLRNQTIAPLMIDALLETGRLTLRRLDLQTGGARMAASGIINDQGRIAEGHLDVTAAPDTAAIILSGFAPTLEKPLSRLPRGALTLTLSAAGPPEALALRTIIDLGDLHAEALPVLDLTGRRWTSALNLRHPGAPRFLDMLGLGGTAAWLGDGSLSFSGNLAGSFPLAGPMRLTAEGFDLSAGRLRAGGALSLDLGATPRIAGRITAETLPLPLPYAHAPEALPVGLLAGWQASVKLEAGQVLVGLSPFLQQAGMVVSLNNGVVQIDTIAAQLEGGTVGGSAVFDTASLPPALKTDLTLAGVMLHGPLFELPFDLAGGVIDGKASITASGYSAGALLSTLDGNLHLSIRDGVIVGVDLPRMGARLEAADLRAALAGGTTAFTQFDIDAALHNGAAIIQSGPFISPTGNGALLGLLDIAGQTTELRLAVRPNVAEPPEIAVRISGPIAAPNRTAEIADAQRWRAEHP